MSTREPIIYLNGRRLAANASTAATGQLIGVAETRIPWGRETITDEIAPHVATVKLIERTPKSRFPARGSYIGAAIRIDSPRAAVSGFVEAVFIGKVTEQTVREVDLDDGRAIEVTLTCADVPGILTQRTVRGDYSGFTTGGSRRYPGAWKWRGYSQQRPAERMAHMTNDPAVGELIGTWALAGNTSTLLDGVQGDSVPDAWSLINQLYALQQPLGRPNLSYGNELRATSPQPATHVELYRTPSGTISIRFIGGTRLEPQFMQLESADVMPDLSVEHKFATVSTQLNKRIRNLIIKNAQQTDETEDSTETLTVAVSNSTGSNREYKADLGAGASVTKVDGSEQAGVWPRETTASATQAEAALESHVNSIAQLLGNLNQYAKLPPLTVRDEPDEYQTRWAFDLFEPRASFALWIAGNKWSSMRQVPRIVQKIGGELVWTGKRWEHTINFAPAVDDLGKNATIGDTLGTIDDPINNVARDVTIAQLPDVTRSAVT